MTEVKIFLLLLVKQRTATTIVSNPTFNAVNNVVEANEILGFRNCLSQTQTSTAYWLSGEGVAIVPDVEISA